MTTLANLVNDTKRHLYSGQREPMNKLAAAIDATVETVAFTYDTTQIQPGGYLQVDLELMYVWAVDASGKSATVSRGYMGSTAASHAAGVEAVANPKFPDFAIVKAINDDLLDLSSPMNGLFAVRTVELTGTSHTPGYDLDAPDLFEILSVSQKIIGLPRDWQPATNYDLDRNAGSDFASGTALRLLDGVQSGAAIRVTYKASFSPLVNLTDDVESVAGLPVSMADLPPLGAAIALVAPREIRRNFTDSQGDSRRAEEVPPGAVSASVRTLAIRRQGRIMAEASRLAQAFPERQFMPLPMSGW